MDEGKANNSFEPDSSITQLTGSKNSDELKKESSMEKQDLYEVIQSLIDSMLSQLEQLVVEQLPLPQDTKNTMSSKEEKSNEILMENLSENSLDKLQITNYEALETEASESTKDVEMADNSTCFQYVWGEPLKLLRVASKEYEPSRRSENYTKGCQWSPDGTCLLVPSEDFRLRIYELPRELYSGKLPEVTMPLDFSAVLAVKEGGLVYDTCWYPFMNSWDPATCCFLSTSRESPVHLWDAFTGELRATYRAYNQVDEVEASISVRFIDSGREIWCGFKNTLRIFDTERPGRQVSAIQFKKEFPNATGLVSCIRENPIMPGLIAFGTYSKCIGLYKNGPLCSFKTGSGVTQIEFSPCGTKLFSAARRSDEFLCWDLRNPGTVFCSLRGRKSDTNQRIEFDMTNSGKQVVSGGTDGKVSIWELAESTTIDDADLDVRYGAKLSRDCINGLSLHKSLPIIATTSGQRLCDEGTHNRDNSVRLWWAYS